MEILPMSSWISIEEIELKNINLPLKLLVEHTVYMHKKYNRDSHVGSGSIVNIIIIDSGTVQTILYVHVQDDRSNYCV